LSLKGTSEGRGRRIRGEKRWRKQRLWCKKLPEGVGKTMRKELAGKTVLDRNNRERIYERKWFNVLG